jgi:hypothetical protein
MATRALVVASLLAVSAKAAAQPAKLTIGIYAPTVEFGTAQARLAYAQSIARTIEQATGIKTEAQAYATVAALEKDKLDYAIVDGPCVATRSAWKVLAAATIGGATSRTWALYSSAGDSLHALEGKKLAFVAMGCNDAGFTDNAMLESEVHAAFFGARVGEKDLTGALASVTSYKTAQAVFAPVGTAKGLTKIFDGSAVPNPAFVELSGGLPAGTTDKVVAAVLGHTGGGAIGGWTKSAREPYSAFATRLAPVKKQGVFATPEPTRIDARDVLAEPATIKTPALVNVRRLFVRPTGARME